MGSRGIRQFFLTLTVLAGGSALLAEHAPGQFVRREGTHLMREKQRFYYLGANCFYLAYFSQDTNVATNGVTWREMSEEVLARCKDMGISAIRIWAFNEDDKQEFSALHGDWRIQTNPGVYQEQALAGLDYALNAANELDLYLVLTLVNNWSDYGGMMWYVTNSPTAAGAHDEFYTDAWCRQWYKDHFATLANRTNTINGRVYREDPTILSWQLANEPRCSDLFALTNWVREMASYIKSIDTNHMVSTGEEGWEPEWTLDNSCSNIDYAVIHCWPDWWWFTENEATMYSNAMSWVTDRIAAAEHTLGKPIVLSEYGRLHPKWGGPPLDDAYGRNSYHRGWFDAIYSSASANGPAAGMHFWMIEADNSGHDDKVGSVFSTDASTCQMIRDQARQMNTLISPEFTNIVPGPAGLRLGWSRVVGNPAFRVELSANLLHWESGALVSTNEWIDEEAITIPQRFYRVVPEY